MSWMLVIAKYWALFFRWGRVQPGTRYNHMFTRTYMSSLLAKRLRSVPSRVRFLGDTKGISSSSLTLPLVDDSYGKTATGNGLNATV